MTTRVLALDDDNDRLVEIRNRYAGCDLMCCQTIAEFTAELDTHRHLVLLDHDLNDYGPADMYGYRPEYTGQHAAEALIKATWRPDLVIVHSWNPDGAKAMVIRLRRAGFCVRQEPFAFSRRG